MRIEHIFSRSTSNEEKEKIPFSTKTVKDTISQKKERKPIRPTCLQCMTQLKRKISYFFRSIFSCCFDAKPQIKISPTEIQYFKGLTVGEKKDTKFQLFVNGFKTDNAIIFEKKGKKLQILDITFPDLEMREHMHSLLEHMLKQEKANTFTVSYLNHAEKLWKNGFYTRDKIHYDPKRKDISNQTIRKIIQSGQEKRKEINDFYQAALDRIEFSLTPQEYPFQSVIEFFYDMAVFFHLIKPHSGNIALSDLLILLDVVEVNTRGVRFGSFGKGAVKFKIEEHYEANKGWFS